MSIHAFKKPDDSSEYSEYLICARCGISATEGFEHMADDWTCTIPNHYFGPDKDHIDPPEE